VRLEEAQAIKNGEVERLINSRLVSAKAVLEKEIEALSAERDGLSSRLADIQINQGVVFSHRTRWSARRTSRLSWRRALSGWTPNIYGTEVP